MRFLTNPHKPMILALARPDPKKNITTLLRAFGECRPLRELANLVTNYLSILCSIKYSLKYVFVTVPAIFSASRALLETLFQCRHS